MLIDTFDQLDINPADYGNEVQSLQMLGQGILFLVNSVRFQEHKFAKLNEKYIFIQVGGTPEEVKEQQLVGCMFHWFAVSVCNYARLVGFIHILETKQFTRRDLSINTMKPKVSKAISDFVESIPELDPVVRWRNKVAGHFAITAPYKDDNMATLDLSVMHPVSLENGIYYVGGHTLYKKNSTGEHVSDLPHWSVTEVFESLLPRFWPNVTQQSKSIV